MTREEAIEKVRWGLLGLVIDKDVRDAFETLVPELRESEDERIRMALIEYFAAPVPFTEVHGIPVQKVRDWLKKQKEKKWNDTAIKDDDEKTRKKLISLINWSGTPWDERDKDKFIEYLEMQKEQKPAEWSEDDEKMRNLIVAIFEVNHPDGFFKANELSTIDMRGVHTEEIISWLKSLRPQPHWKPSKEEIDAFENLLKGEFPNKIFPGTTLANLLNKLKKLYYNEAIQVWKPSEEQN